MKVSLRSALYLCLAIATVTMLSAGSVAAVHSTTGNNGSSHSSSSNPSLTVLYDDGPTNGTQQAFFIDGPGGPFQQQIINGFVAATSGTAAVLDFGMWVPSGTAPQVMTWYLGTTPYGQDVSTGFEFLDATTNTLLCTNGSAYNGGICSGGFGYDVYEVRVSTMSGSLTAGNTYWLTLGGANDTGFTQFDAWDLNLGPAICQFAVGGNLIGDCGAGGGNAFTLYAQSNTGVPEPGSFLLLGSGVLGLAGVLRRKLGRKPQH